MNIRRYPYLPAVWGHQQPRNSKCGEECRRELYDTACSLHSACPTTRPSEPRLIARPIRSKRLYPDQTPQPLQFASKIITLASPSPVSSLTLATWLSTCAGAAHDKSINMSDIDECAYSAYDDLEDILYDADPAPDLADDLADHAIHSPIYRDEDAVKAELQDYFSDWEYYSDDYMDDDPSLLKTNPQGGSPVKRAGKDKQSAQRGRKRKLVATEDIPPLNLDEFHLLTRCIKGTIWADSNQAKTPYYKDGEVEKVALLKDWKKLFSVKNNGWGRSSEDESWATNLSLEDMGLWNLPRQSSLEEENEQGQPILSEEEEDIVDDMDVTDAEAIMPAEIKPGPSLSRLSHTVLLDEDGQGEIVSSMIGSEADAAEESPRKRRRVKSGLPTPPESNGVNGSATSKKPLVGDVPRKAATKSQHETAVTNGNTLPAAASRLPVPTKPPQSKKRKNEGQGDEDSDEKDSESKTKSRAKRIASTAAKSNAAVPSSARVTRSTRSK
jgi:hypothetical protein